MESIGSDFTRGQGHRALKTGVPLLLPFKAPGFLFACCPLLLVPCLLQTSAWECLYLGPFMGVPRWVQVAGRGCVSVLWLPQQMTTNSMAENSGNVFSSSSEGQKLEIRTIEVSAGLRSLRRR